MMQDLSWYYSACEELISDYFRCGVLLDAWMFPVHKDLLDTGIQQPILFINSYVHHKWKANMDKIFKLLKPPNHKGMMLFTS